MITNSAFLRGTLYGLLLIGVQACTQDVPTPTASANSSDAAKLLDKDKIKVRKAKHLIVDIPSKPGKKKIGEMAPRASLQQVCYDNWDIYFNWYTGEVISREYTGRTCTDVGSTGSSGGTTGSTGGGSTSGSTSNGSYGISPTTDPEDLSPPALCNS